MSVKVIPLTLQKPVERFARVDCRSERDLGCTPIEYIDAVREMFPDAELNLIVQDRPDYFHAAQLLARNETEFVVPALLFSKDWMEQVLAYIKAE